MNFVVNKFRNLVALPPRFDILKKYNFRRDLKILDVGCGLNSASLSKLYFPNCKYYGIDILERNRFLSNEIKLIEKYWQKDINKADLKDVPNKFFDLIILSHIIEHINNGEELIHSLSQKLKLNGIFYIEFPSSHTKSLPSLKKKNLTFNFYDDATHLRLYKKEDIINFLNKYNFSVNEAKSYFKLKKILFSPLFILYILRKRNFKELNPVLWYLTGWCSYIIATKQRKLL